MAEYKGKLLKGLFTRATKCLMSDGATSVESVMRANEFGTAVTLTVNTVYTCPSDGYLSISSGNNAGEYVFILIYGATGDTYVSKILRTVTTNSPLFDSMFIKKGMRLYPSAIAGNAKFIPLNA